MPLTSQERSAINRQNAANSTGPKSNEGKAASRRNALKHGLRADALALPNEDPGIVSARNDSWNDYYQPQSPAAQHLVNQCVQATLLADRCHQFHHAALAKQIREFELNNDVYDDYEARSVARGFVKNPADTLHRLTQSGAGLRYLISRWEALGQSLEDDKHWTSAECDEAIRLQGIPAHKDTLASYPDAWLTRLYSLICTPRVSKFEMAALFEGIRFPSQYKGFLDPDHLPELEPSLASLHGTVDEKLATLRACEEEYRELYEDSARAESESRAMILRDASTARLFLRYHAESRTAFHRAYRELVKTLEADAASPVEDAPDAPEASPPPPQTAVSPNEPNSDVSAEDRAALDRLDQLLKDRPGPVGYLTHDDERPRQFSGLCVEPLSLV